MQVKSNTEDWVLAISRFKLVPPSIVSLGYKSLKVFLKIKLSALGALGRRFESSPKVSNNPNSGDTSQTLFYFLQS